MFRKTRQGNTTQQKEKATQHNLPKAVIFSTSVHVYICDVEEYRCQMYMPSDESLTISAQDGYMTHVLGPHHILGLGQSNTVQSSVGRQHSIHTSPIS